MIKEELEQVERVENRGAFTIKTELKFILKI